MMMDKKVMVDALSKIILKAKPPITFLHLSNFKIPIYKGDTTDTVIDRISDNPEIPFHRSEIDGQLVLMQDQAINKIKIKVDIKL